MWGLKKQLKDSCAIQKLKLTKKYAHTVKEILLSFPFDEEH